jgi:multicomponent Na+:H+ antiporter subunit E
MPATTTGHPRGNAVRPGINRILSYKTLAFFALWLLLSQSYNAFHMVLGFFVSFGVALLNTEHGKPSSEKIRWFRMLAYVPWLVSRIIQSGIHLSYLILHPRLPIDPKLIRHQTSLKGEAGIVLFGNSITLTPGTITAEVNSNELLVHAMDDASADDVTSLRMEQKVAGIFRVRE